MKHYFLMSTLLIVPIFHYHNTRAAIATAEQAEYVRKCFEANIFSPEGIIVPKRSTTIVGTLNPNNKARYSFENDTLDDLYNLKGLRKYYRSQNQAAELAHLNNLRILAHLIPLLCTTDIELKQLLFLSVTSCKKEKDILISSLRPALHRKCVILLHTLHATAFEEGVPFDHPLTPITSQIVPALLDKTTLATFQKLVENDRLSVHS